MGTQEQKHHQTTHVQHVETRHSYTVFQNQFVANNRKFAFIYLIFQGCMIALNGIFLRPQAHRSILDNGLFSAVGTALLVLIGFGLYFSYLNKLRWSGIGFTFLITALVFQYYFLINAFWTKAHVQYSNTGFNDTYMPAYLSDQNSDVKTSGGVDSYGNTAVGALKCALSLSIAFAAFGGRGGPLQAIIIVIFGTITYELNRQVCSLFSVDKGGSATIFQFGGIMGVAISLILYLTNHRQIISNNNNYRASQFSVTMSLVGSAFIWVFFPVLNMDIPNTLFVFSNAGISTIFSISTCVISTIAMSLIANGRLQYRDLLTAPILGGVIIGSSSTYIYNPAEAIIFGFIASFLQIIFNRLQTKFGSNPYWSNGVLFLFAVQGLIGSLFSSVIRAINRSGKWEKLYDELNPKYEFEQGGQISATFVTLGIALLSGLIIGLIIKCATKQTRQSLYDDHTYWDIYQDGLSYRQVEEKVTQYVESDHDIVQVVQADKNHEYL